MLTKGKGSKVFVATRKSRSRFVTFPRGDTSQEVRNKPVRASICKQEYLDGLCVGSKRQAGDAVWPYDQ